MSTPDTSSDDATLAAFEASIPTFHGSTSLDRKVVAIARRLQGELKDANDDADSLAREKQHHEDMRRQAEAEVRELRATIAELSAIVEAVKETQAELRAQDRRYSDLYRAADWLDAPLAARPKAKMPDGEQSLFDAALADATTGDKP